MKLWVLDSEDVGLLFQRTVLKVGRAGVDKNGRSLHQKHILGYKEQILLWD
jgi:ribosomal protein S6E (S10)